MRKLVLATLLWAAPALGAAADPFTLTAPDIKPNGIIPDKFVFNNFGCSGQNLSPALAWKNPPAGTKSFVLTVYDPDAPTGGGWWHWVMFNIPATATGLPEGAGTPGKEPAGAIQSTTDFGPPGYGGPCPPKGDQPHHYVFTLFALKTDKLDLSNTSMPDLVGFMTHAATLGRASFTARYGR